LRVGGKEGCVATLRDVLVVPHLAAAEPANDEGGCACRSEPDDHARLAALYAEHGAGIYRFLRDLLGDPSLAADATQETLLRAFRQLGTFRDGERVRPWLFGIARNVSLELRRANHRAARYVVASDHADAAAEGSPESEVLGREALRIVGEALARLSEERRAMLVLRLDHGMAYEDIARAMGCSLSKVKVEIWRAREVLRAVMAEYER
jgi:RNA polymerase sigma-70 factor, ECF subfamily